MNLLDFMMFIKEQLLQFSTNRKRYGNKFISISDIYINQDIIHSMQCTLIIEMKRLFVFNMHVVICEWRDNITHYIA